MARCGSGEPPFTHAQLTLRLSVLEDARGGPPGEGEWWPVDQLDEAGLPTVFAKAARLALAGAADGKMRLKSATCSNRRYITFAENGNKEYAGPMDLPASLRAAWRFIPRRHAIALFCPVLLLGAAPPTPEMPRFAHWIDGTTPNEPETQVQEIDADTFVIRQSVETNFEAPFLYLLFGQDRVLLIDTGAGGLKIRPAVDRTIDQWRAKHGDRAIHLVVAHSHGHGDHHAGDDEFRDRPDTDIVGLAPEDVAAYFHIEDWPRDIARFDLGGRVLDIIPTPGHQPAHIMIDDRARSSCSRPHALSGPTRRSERPVRRVPRERRPARRFRRRPSDPRAARSAYRDHHHGREGLPDEGPVAPLGDARCRSRPSAIGDLQQALAKMGSAPVIDPHADFIVYPLTPQPASWRELRGPVAPLAEFHFPTRRRSATFPEPERIPTNEPWTPLQVHAKPLASAAGAFAGKTFHRAYERFEGRCVFLQQTCGSYTGAAPHQPHHRDREHDQAEVAALV